MHRNNTLEKYTKKKKQARIPGLIFFFPSLADMDRQTSVKINPELLPDGFTLLCSTRFMTWSDIHFSALGFAGLYLL